MPAPLDLIFMIAALLCFLAAAAGMPTKINLTALGLAFWVFTLIV